MKREDYEKVSELLDDLLMYVQNDNIESISPVTHRKHEEGRQAKSAEIYDMIHKVEVAKDSVCQQSST